MTTAQDLVWMRVALIGVAVIALVATALLARFIPDRRERARTAREPALQHYATRSMTSWT